MPKDYGRLAKAEKDGRLSVGKTRAIRVKSGEGKPDTFLNQTLHNPTIERLAEKTVIQASIPPEELDAMKLALREMWQEHSIPEALQSSFESCVYRLSRRKITSFVKEEIQSLEDETAPVLQAIQAVEMREVSLRSLKELTTHIGGVTDAEFQTVALDFCELLVTHRILTLNALDTIVKWREVLVYALLLDNTPESIQMTKEVAFIWEGGNYLMKMKTDSDFLKNTALCRVFNFSKLPDPFLVAPTQRVHSARNSALVKVVLGMPSVLLSKIRLAELVLKAEVAQGIAEGLREIPMQQPKVKTKKVNSKHGNRVGALLEVSPQKRDSAALQIRRIDSEARQLTKKEDRDRISAAIRDEYPKGNSSQSLNSFSITHTGGYPVRPTKTEASTIEIIVHSPDDQSPTKPHTIRVNEPSGIFLVPSNLSHPNLYPPNQEPGPIHSTLKLGADSNGTKSEIEYGTGLNLADAQIPQYSQWTKETLGLTKPLQDYSEMSYPHEKLPIKSKPNPDYTSQAQLSWIETLGLGETDKIAYHILIDYLKEFSEEYWVDVLVNTVLVDESALSRKLLRINTSNPTVEVTHPMDYGRELFTPGVHSPNAYSIAGASSIRDFTEASSFISYESEDSRL